MKKPGAGKCKKSLINTILLGILLMLIALVFSACSSTTAPKAFNGQLDLLNWKQNQKPVLKLKGEWEFYWNELISPEDFSSGIYPEKTDWMTLPGKWNEYTVDGAPLSPKGFATFRLTINNCRLDKVYGLKILDMGTAYRLWIDDQLLMSNGIVGKNADETVAQYLPQTAQFKPAASTIQITLQVANFRHRKGGVWKAIEFGYASDISDKREWNLAIQLFLFGSLVIMGLYHLGLYFIRPKDRSSLYFGIVSLITGFRSIIMGERFFIWCFPDFNWELFQKIEYLSFYLGPPIFLKFINSLFEEYPAKVARLCVFIAAIFCLIVLLTPIAIYAHTVNPYEIILLPFAIHVIYATSKAAKNGKDGAKWMIIGMLIFFSTIIYDILATNELVPPIYLSSFGLFLFIFVQSFMLSIRFSKAFQAVEQVTKELTKAEQRYRSVFENATGGIFLASVDGNIISANPSLLRMFGYDTVAEMDGANTHLTDLLTIDQDDPKSSRSILLEQEEIKNHIFKSSKKDGESIEISANISPVKDEKGKVLYYEGTVEDITHKKASEKLRIAKESAEMANRLKSEFLANISHELRTPMHGVLGFAKLGRDKINTAGRDKLKRFFDEIISSGGSLMDLLNDLLDLSKLESGKADYKLREDLLSTAVSAVVDELQILILDKNIDLKFKRPDTEQVFVFDIHKIMQVIRNLLTNAIKFSDRNDSIEITIQNCVEGDEILLSIKDQGIGIPEDELDSVFDKFIQSSKTNTGAGGTGLGLAISKQIVEDHQGRIWVEQNDDKGVIFYVAIPKNLPTNLEKKGQT